MASISFGGGCLAFPSAVAQCGPIIALLIFIFVGIITYYTLSLLVIDAMKTKIYDYNQLVERTMGSKMLLFSDINNLIICVGCIMSYQIAVYQFALELGNDFFNFEKSDVNRLYIILICFFVIQLPLNCLKNIASLQYASIVGSIALIFCIVVIVAEMPMFLTDYLSRNPFPPLFKQINWNYLDTFSTFLFGFSSHNGVLQIYAELKRPTEERNFKVLRRSFIVEMIVYLGIAFGGFFSTFYDTPDIFLYRNDCKNFTPDYFIKIAKITLFVCLHCNMAIIFNIMRMSLRSIWFANKDIGIVKDFLIMFITYAFCNVAVFYVKNVVVILGIVGGFSTVVISVFNPIIIHIKLSNLPNFHYLNLWRYFILVIISILGITATVKSFVDIIEKLVN